MTAKLIQLVLLAVIALMAVHLIAQKRRGEIGKIQLGLWLAVWIGGAVVVLFPDFATRMASHFGVGRGADLVIYVSIPALFYAVFRLLIRTERLNREVTELTRALAIETQRREAAERDSHRLRT
jgi:hypothetical protein